MPMMGLFGKTVVDPKVQVDEWTKTLRGSTRDMDRQIRNVQREEERAKKSLKDVAKKGDKDACKIIAKEIVRSRKTVQKMHLSKTHVNSLILHMRHQLANLRVSGSLQKSTEVMQVMQSLIKLPEISRIMQDLSKEMMKAGILEEMMEDAMESLDDGEDVEAEADSEVEKVLWELTEGKLGEAPSPLRDSLQAPTTAIADQHKPSSSRTLTKLPPMANESVGDEEEEEDMEEMRKRLQQLKS